MSFEPRYDAHGLHVNRRFMLEWARDAAKATRILDFGCGDDRGIQWGRRNGVEVLGTDLRDATDDDRFALCTETSLPFEDGSFDAIVSNMVFEHVMRPTEILAELHRVLRPGGAMLHMWPSASALFEGHCRLLFAQNLRSHAYLRACHRLGFGVKGRKKRTSSEFATKWLQYMEEQCNYLPEAELRNLFTRAGFTFVHHENEYLVYRLGFTGPLMARTLRRVTTIAIMSERVEPESDRV